MMAKYLAFMQYADEGGEGQIATFELPEGTVDEAVEWAENRWEPCILEEGCSADSIVIDALGRKPHSRVTREFERSEKGLPWGGMPSLLSNIF